MSSDCEVGVNSAQSPADSLGDAVVPVTHAGQNTTRALLSMLLLGTSGALLAWGAAQYFSPAFTVPAEYHVADIGAPIEKLLELKAAKESTSRKNAMLEWSLLGGVLATMLALSGDRRQISLKLILAAAATGIIGGCLAGFAGLWAYVAFGLLLPLSLNGTVLLYTVMLGTLGLFIGLGLKVLSGSLKQLTAWTLAGALAGVMAGVLYPMLNTTLLAAAATDSVLPTGALERLLCYTLFAGSLAVCLSKATQD